MMMKILLNTVECVLKYKIYGVYLQLLLQKYSTMNINVAGVVDRVRREMVTLCSDLCE